MRTRYTFYNLLVNLITSLILPILGFVKLKLFLGLYGSSVNGFQVTMAQIIAILNVFALSYSLAFRQLLFKPLAQNDNQKVLQIYWGARRIFNITGVLVIIVSILIGFSLPYFSKSPFDPIQTGILFTLFALPYGISYFLMGPNLVITADQKEYKINIWIQFFSVLRMLLMIGVILLKMPFFVTLLIEGANILFSECVGRKIALSHYAWLKEKIEGDIKDFSKNVRYVTIQKISNLATNNTDNIVISMLLGYAMSGVYAVYSYLNEFVNKIVSSVISSAINSFGNLFHDNQADSYKVFQEFFTFASFLATIVATCTFVMMNEFIPLILNREDLKNTPITIVLLFAINLFYLTIREPIIISRDVNGLFKNAQRNAALLAVCKIVLSFIFVYFFGISGVLLATLLTNWTIDFLYNPKLVYEHVYQKSVGLYYRMVFSKVCIAVVCSFLFYHLWKIQLRIITQSTLHFLVAAMFLGIFVGLFTLIVYSVCFASFRDFMKRVMNLILRRKSV